MTIVVSNHQRIFYRFEGEKGAYLLLHHGLFGTHEDWYRAGYVDALRDEFRLIVMDARGHGRSDHPLDPEQYRLSDYAADVIAIMEELDIRNLHICGYSLGALVGFELLMRYPDRVRIVMLAGESPFVSEEMQAGWSELAGRIEREGLTAVRDQLSRDERLVSLEPRSEQEGEQQAAMAVLNGLAAEPVRPDEGRISVGSPVALFTGEEDPAANRIRDARRRIHRARFVSFPKQSHKGLFAERELLTGEILRLLRPGRRSGGEETQPARQGRARGRSGRTGSGRSSDQHADHMTQNAGEHGRTEAALTPPPPVDVPAHLRRDPPQPSLPAEHDASDSDGTAGPIGQSLQASPDAGDAPDNIQVRARQEQIEPDSELAKPFPGEELDAPTIRQHSTVPAVDDRSEEEEDLPDEEPESGSEYS